MEKPGSGKCPLQIITIGFIYDRVFPESYVTRKDADKKTS